MTSARMKDITRDVVSDISNQELFRRVEKKCLIQPSAIGSARDMATFPGCEKTVESRGMTNHH